MTRGILGEKLGMTQVFDEEGNAIPVTVIKAGPCTVVQKKVSNKDGYNAIQLGYGAIKPKKANRPLKGHFDKAKVGPVAHLREFRLEKPDEYEVGQEIKVDIFKPGDVVDVTGTSRGKGFAGAIKRWGFHRGPMSHGSKYHRGPGSLGASADPSRVLKGRKMPGRMGGEKTTVQNIKVVKVDPDRNLLLVKGAVPGARGSIVAIRDAVKVR